MRSATQLIHGLSGKLALFFIALAFPALLLVESTIVMFEFHRFQQEIDAGALRAATTAEAAQLGPRMPLDAESMHDSVEGWLLRLSQPRDGLTAEGAYVMLELSEQPLAASAYDMDGTLLARSGNPDSAPPEPETVRAALSGVAAERASDGGPTMWRTVTVPMRDARGAVVGALHARVEVPLPWRRLLLNLSFEWPIVLAYLLVFGIASAFFLTLYVTRRLSRIASAADQWSRGDFSAPIGDRADDELGRLSRRLDLMARELAEHLAMRAQLASMEERQRLARDLHDTVKQKAFALNLQLAAAQSLLERDPAQARSRVGEAQHLVDEIQQELAAILQEMRREGSDTALASRARQLAEDWSRRSGITAQWTRCETSSVLRWMQDHVLRVLEEALANAWRHSGARRVDLELGVHEGDNLLLSVADNGRGLAGEGEGMGLRNMRERALALPGGRIAFDSRTGEGTRVSLVWRRDKEDQER